MATDRVGVIIAGGGARGAYEAGVLSVVLPRLEGSGARARTFVGTSAGAINATVLAAHAHLPVEDQVAALLTVWRTISAKDVFRPLLRTSAGTALTWWGQLLGVPGARLTGLVDTSPLARTADQVLDWSQVRKNIDDAAVECLALVTTSARTGRTVVFVDQRPGRPLPARDEDRGLDYVGTPVTKTHVLASAAIPVLFPAVRVSNPPDLDGWYIDGGLRLNTPIKPALALGCDAVVVIATHPASYASPSGDPDGDGDGDEQPDVDDALVMLLDAAMVDRMVEDVRTLRKVNELVAAGARRGGGQRPYTIVPHLFLGPEHRSGVGGLAAALYRERFTGVRGAARAVRSPDLPLLARLLAGDGPRRGDVLSYLLFDTEFAERAIDLGRKDASARLAGSVADQLPWTRTSLDRPVEDQPGRRVPPQRQETDMERESKASARPDGAEGVHRTGPGGAE